MPVNYDAIPEELRWDNNWCVAGPDENGRLRAPHILQGRKLYKASPVNPTHWRDLETTIESAMACPPCGIGYVLTAQCGYTVIDLDVKNQNNYPDDPDSWTDEEDLERFWKIVQMFDSYTERSASGQGLHIWVKGDIGPGVHGRDGVEVYSRERFIVTTGDVVIDKPIYGRQELLQTLVSEIRANQAGDKIELVEVEQTETDEVILERAVNAENRDKFTSLMSATADVGTGDKKVQGSYVDLGYPSQSEADLALMSIFTFYTKSNEQCRRLFRLSNLAKRPKASKNNRYLDFTLKLIRGRQEREEAIDDFAADLARKYQQNYAHLTQQNGAQQAQTDGGEVAPQPMQIPVYGAAVEEVQATDSEQAPLAWPPGFAGYIARYIYENSPRPVREVSIVATLGLLCGICGKAFTLPQSGLNLYIVLIARSAIGKEAMHSGIATLIGYLRESMPDCGKFVDFSEYASGPALQKAVATNTSFVNVSGEWGRRLKRLSQEDGRDGPMQQLRTVMTNLYQKSGPRSIVGGVGYSDKEKNVGAVNGVAYSMIGESTPTTFYEALTEDMMEDGFLSRFTVIEYTGDRPELNEKPQSRPPDVILSHLSEVCWRANQLLLAEQYVEVMRTPEAFTILAAFDKECDSKVRGSTDESWRQMWNRAHLKALRISGLLACADNPNNPIILKEHAAWALDVVLRDIAVMRRRMSEGDIGKGDNTRERKVMSLIQKYMEKDFHQISTTYRISKKMKDDSVITRSYLQINTQKINSFCNFRGGQNIALDATLKSMCDSGYLAEVPREKAVKEYEFTGKCYRILSTY